MPVYRQQLIEAKNAYRARDYARAYEISSWRTLTPCMPRCTMTSVNQF
jgi:hypothetical protein